MTLPDCLCYYDWYEVTNHENANKEDNLHHFVSDIRYDTSNVRNKFEDAAHKLVEFYRTVAPTDAASWLINNSARYPGLGVLKKITMKNHIELVTGILAEIER